MLTAESSGGFKNFFMWDSHLWGAEPTTLFLWGASAPQPPRSRRLCSQALYDLRLMRQHGMSNISLQSIFKSSLLSKILYASQSWWGFTSQSTRNQIDGFFAQI